jgi:hypothetical protein
VRLGAPWALSRGNIKRAPHGPDDLFISEEVDALVAVLDQVRAAAIAA